jgi:hypothetical protein
MRGSLTLLAFSLDCLLAWLALWQRMHMRLIPFHQLQHSFHCNLFESLKGCNLFESLKGHR